MLIIIFLSGLAVPLLGCGSESDETEPSESQVVTVQRGNLTIDITAAGNLALSTTEQNYDLEVCDTGTCSVTVADGERLGDFTCPALMEDVVHEHQSLPFAVIGHWECAEVVEDS